MHIDETVLITRTSFVFFCIGASLYVSLGATYSVGFDLASLGGLTDICGY